MPWPVPLAMPLSKGRLPDPGDDVRDAHVSWLHHHQLLPVGPATGRYVKSRLPDVTAFCDVGSQEPLLSANVCGWIFMHDDWMDQLFSDGTNLMVTAELVSVLHHPVAPTGPLTKAFSDLWNQLRTGMSDSWNHRMEWLWQEYLHGNYTEAINRREGRRPTIHEHLRTKDASIAAGVMFAVAERTGGFEVPVEVWHAGYLAALRRHAARHIVLTNDIQSFDQDLAAMHANVVALIMHENELPLAEALNATAQEADRHIHEFCSLTTELDSFCSRMELAHGARRSVERHIESLRNWIRGSYDWYEVTDRYDSDSG